MPITQVGNELQEVDFGELVRSIAQGIADGQRALDLTAINTLQVLANTPVSLIPFMNRPLRRMARSIEPLVSYKCGGIMR